MTSQHPDIMYISTEEWLTTGQAARILRLAPGTLQNYRTRGEGPAFIKRGHQVFYTRESIEAYLNSCSQLCHSTLEWKEKR